MKRIIVLASLLVSVMVACKSSEEFRTSSEKFRVALVLDKGGVDDKSFNASAFLGADRAKKELGIDLKYVEITDDAQVEPALKNFAQKNYNLVISIGFAQQEALKKAAESHLSTRFAIVDAEVVGPNVASLMFMEHEGSYLAGALAAMKSKTAVIGFVGGMDIPLIRRFELGYKEGAKKVNPQIKVVSNYVGITGDAWNNPTKAKELAINQFSQKADIIFHAAGASGQGVFDAVEERTHKNPNSAIYAIGVDSNQNWVKPGLVLTSMMKRVDVAVFETIKLAKEGKFRAGRKNFGLNDAGIDLAMDDNNKNLIDVKTLAEIEKLKQDIINAKISVSDYYKLK